MSEPTITDEVVAWCDTKGKRFHNQGFYYGAFASDLRRARRYVLDDDFLRLAVHMSTMPASILAECLQRSRTPFERIILEFNNRLRLEEYWQMIVQPDQVFDGPERLAFYIERDPHNNDQFRLISFYQSPLCTEFAPYQWVYCLTGNAPNHDERMNVIYDGDPETSSALNIAALMKEGLDKHGIDEITSPKIVTPGRVGWAFHPMHHKGIGEHMIVRRLLHAVGYKLSPYFNHKQVAQSGRIYEFAKRHDLLEQAGSVRFAVAALSLINTLEIDVSAPRRAGKSRIVGGKPMPYMTYSIVGLKRPLKHAVRAVMRDFKGTAAARRRHEVTGHFKVVRKGPGRKIEELKWINSYMRGNAKVGFVEHDYTVAVGD